MDRPISAGLGACIPRLSVESRERHMRPNHFIIGLGGTGGKIIRAFRKAIYQEFREGSPDDGIALTYDDGPNDPHTLRLLEVLARHNVPATFFLIGRYVKQRPDIVRELVRAGHVIGNHTFSQ